MSYWWYLNFTVEEIKESVWQCERSKSSGLDGFNVYFIKQFWDILKTDVVAFIQEFHNNGKLVRGINTIIVLIPKKDSPLKVEDFRPISFIRSMYKILTKLVAAWL